MHCLDFYYSLRDTTILFHLKSFNALTSLVSYFPFCCVFTCLVLLVHILTYEELEAVCVINLLVGFCVNRLCVICHEATVRRACTSAEYSPTFVPFAWCVLLHFKGCASSVCWILFVVVLCNCLVFKESS